MTNKAKNNWREIFLRLLFDFFLILGLVFLLTFLGEALIPGIITNKIGWRYLIGFLFLDLGLIYLFSKRIGIALGSKLFFNKIKTSFLEAFVLIVFVGSFWRGDLVSILVAILAYLIIKESIKILED